MSRDSSFVSAYDYFLPPDRIAQEPVEPRSSARLLVDLARPGDPRPDLSVADLPDLLSPGDVVAVNETRVLPARLELQKATGGAAEVFLLERVGDSEGDLWQALVRPGRRLPPGTTLFGEDGCAVIEVGDLLEGAGDDGTGRRLVRVLADPERYGTVPLPPYIKRALPDSERYQTVYARVPGSVAAPTAGLHLDAGVLGRLAARGVTVVAVELAVGLDTFRPIAVEDLREHRMHTERYHVPEPTLAACARAQAAGGRVVAIGTTTLRALESAAATGACEGRTDLFIRPGFEFRLVDTLLTNFHMPRSTLLVLLAAFAGAPRWRELYELALRDGFRFLSFGDAMLVSRQ